ncbi:methyltransferase type 12 [Grosmannia clavigera kw1407]|uniref:Methyltransferase type 12 n=1 Tax=Grosmannia clavigera (strain kw1407 / UAMH 11150) TaxID=655863 RepID=F0XFI5_GROCL|nr:methyltransferase type 12 [Grosmannia clavigera kw1407]EFX03665.1 methyltransferase type 12 [Grosmannia clavigera kw1407]
MADLDDSSDFIEPASDNVSLRTEELATVTSDYEPTLNESLVGSLTSSVYAHVYENGRRYHMYKQGLYPLPNDDGEYGRESIRHALFLDLLSGRLHLAPIGDSPQKIMDIGTGFGDWSIEMGDKYPSARVIGLDLSPIQPVWVPPNVEFVVEDAEEDQWIHGNDFDFIHFRVAAVVLKDPIRVAATAFDNLKPGGWIEFQEILPRVGCNDSTMPDDYAMQRYYHTVCDIMARKYGWDAFVAERLPVELERIGFVNIQRKVYHVPIGFWPKDKKRMHHAFLYREVVNDTMPALRAKPLVGNDVGLTPDEIDSLFADTRAALCLKRVHAYVPFHFVWAQKPQRMR